MALALAPLVLAPPAPCAGPDVEIVIDNEEADLARSVTSGFGSTTIGGQTVYDLTRAAS